MLRSAIIEEVRAPFAARLASRLRVWLDPIVSPQLATVATMLLVAVFVLSNTVSSDGSISGVYRASLRLAEQSYTVGSKGGIKELTNGLKELVGGQSRNPQSNVAPKPETAGQSAQPKAGKTPSEEGQNKH